MDFVIVANAWSAGERNPTSKHRIALELARRGHRVLWLSGAGMRRPNLGAAADRGRIWRRLVEGCRRPARIAESAAIHLAAPLLLPLPGREWVRRLNGTFYACAGRWWARRLGFQEPTLINYVPTLGYAQGHWPWRCVYHCVDRWSAFDMYDSAVMAYMDRLCCETADVVIASSQELFLQCQRHNRNVQLVRHGVDYEHFKQALEIRSPRTPDAGARAVEKPKDLPAGRIVGFFGLLSEWIDQELLVQLARRLRGNDECRTPSSECRSGNAGSGGAIVSSPITHHTVTHLVLIGPADVDVGRLAAEPGVCLLGPKPFAELPAYVAHFDVGIVPFLVNDLTRAVNPIKLREMLAAGCPVVATALPEIQSVAQVIADRGLLHQDRQRPRAIGLAGSRTQFVEQVAGMLADPLTEAERERLSESMRSESWEMKVDALLAAMFGGGGSV